MNKCLIKIDNSQYISLSLSLSLQLSYFINLYIQSICPCNNSYQTHILQFPLSWSVLVLRIRSVSAHLLPYTTCLQHHVALHPCRTAAPGSHFASLYVLRRCGLHIVTHAFSARLYSRTRTSISAGICSELRDHLLQCHLELLCLAENNRGFYIKCSSW